MKLSMGGLRVDFLVDSGCNSNLIDRKTLEYLQCHKDKVSDLRADSDKAFVPFGSKVLLKIMARFKAELDHNGRKTMEQFFVVDAEEKCILGAETAKRIGVLKILNVEKKAANEFPALEGVKVHITLDPNVKPRILPPRKMSLTQEKILEEMLKKTKIWDQRPSQPVFKISISGGISPEEGRLASHVRRYEGSKQVRV